MKTILLIAASTLLNWTATLARPIPEPSIEFLRDNSTHSAIFKIVKAEASKTASKGSPHPNLSSYVAYTAECELISSIKGDLPKQFLIRFFVYDKPAFNGSVCAYFELFVGSSFLGYLEADPDAPGEFMSCLGHLDEGLAFRYLTESLIKTWMQEVRERKRKKYEAQKAK
jgi:hypothetical protein